MSRYIDADALEYDTEWSEYHDGFTAYSQLAIDTAPSIDIVRCKECKRKDTFKCWMRNTQVPRYPSDDDFCSYGEREDE
jgi:hypothetical protein